MSIDFSVLEHVVFNIKDAKSIVNLFRTCTTFHSWGKYIDLDITTLNASPWRFKTLTLLKGNNIDFTNCDNLKYVNDYRCVTNGFKDMICKEWDTYSTTIETLGINWHCDIVCSLCGFDQIKVPEHIKTLIFNSMMIKFREVSINFQASGFDIQITGSFDLFKSLNECRITIGNGIKNICAPMATITNLEKIDDLETLECFTLIGTSRFSNLKYLSLYWFTPPSNVLKFPKLEVLKISVFNSTKNIELPVLKTLYYDKKMLDRICPRIMEKIERGDITLIHSN